MPTHDLTPFIKDLQARIDALSPAERRAALPELAEDHEPSRGLFIAHIAFQILALGFFVFTLTVVFRDHPVALKASAIGGLLVFGGLERWTQARRAAEDQRQLDELAALPLEVALGCEVLGYDPLFTEGAAHDDALFMLVTRTPHFMADAERFEWLASQVVRCLPDAIERGLDKDLPPALRAACVRFLQAPNAGTVALPPAEIGGEAFLATSYFNVDDSPNGYVDRAMWPVLLTGRAQQTFHVLHIPATLWWSPAVDELMEFHGHLGEVYSRIHEQQQDA